MAEENKKDKKKKSKYQTKSFKQLNKKQKESFYNNVKDLKEFVGKTKKQVYKILNTIKTAKDFTSPKKLAKMTMNKLRGSKPLFGPSDRIPHPSKETTMLTVSSKLKADPEAIKGLKGFKIVKPGDVKENVKTGKLQESLRTGSIEKPSRDTPIMDQGKGLPGGVSFHKGGRVRSYRGYGKARRG